MFHDGDGPIPERALQQIQDALKLGRWKFYGMLDQLKSSMDEQWEIIRDATARIDGARYYFEGEHDNPVLATRSRIMSAQPSLAATSTFQWIPNAGHVNFALVSPAAGADAVRQYELVRERARAVGKDYMGTFIVGGRELQHVMPMMFDTADPLDRERTLALCLDVLERAAAEGYGVYRTHPSLMDQVAATYNDHDKALIRLSERIKDALDPAGILAPGKQGIWPARYRGPVATMTSRRRRRSSTCCRSRRRRPSGSPGSTRSHRSSRSSATSPSRTGRCPSRFTRRCATRACIEC